MDRLGFAPFFSITPFPIDATFLIALRERWMDSYHAFVMLWGHMIPTLKDMAYLIGLPVAGAPTLGRELRDYQPEVDQLLGVRLTFTKRPVSTLPLGMISATMVFASVI